MKKKLIQLLFFLILIIGFQKQVYGVPCSVSATGGTINTFPTCSFPNLIDGVDAGTGNTNTAVLTIPAGVQLTILGNQELSVGSLSITGGSINIIAGGRIRVNQSIWMIDADADGYPASTTQTIAASAPAGGRRRNILTSTTLLDCNDANAAMYPGVVNSTTWSGVCTRTGNNCTGTEAGTTYACNGSTGLYDATSSTSRGCNVTNANICRPSTGICDADEYCNGLGSCPTDVYCPNNTVYSGGNCVASGYCSSGSVYCNSDRYRYQDRYRCNGSNSCTTNSYTDNLQDCGAATYDCSNICRRRYNYKCSGGTCGTYTSIATYAAYGEICSGGSIIAGSCATDAYNSSYQCSGQAIQRQWDNWECNGAGMCTSNNSWITQTTCGGGENSRCVAGQSTCQNLCSNSINDDGDGYTDGQDTDCGGGGQCTAGDCCNVATGSFQPISYNPGGTCKKCTGTSATSVNQTAAEDLWGQCGQSFACDGTCRVATTGTGNCNASAACDATVSYVNCGNNTICSAAMCVASSYCSSGSVYCSSDRYRYQDRYRCNGSNSCTTNSYTDNLQDCGAASYDCSNICTRRYNYKCSGGTCGTYTATSTYAGSGQICSAGSIISGWCGSITWGGYQCSGQAIQLQRFDWDCNGAGTCGSTPSWVTQTTCGGGENSRCVAGQSTCQNLCSNGLNDDGDGYTDGQDTDCGGCGQCTSGACCNTATGCYQPNGTSCRAAAGECDIAETCTGSASTCPTDVFRPDTYTPSAGLCLKCTGTSATAVPQTAAQDLWGQCTTGANGSATSCTSNFCQGSTTACGYLTGTSTCRTSTNACDPAETCSGTVFTCPSDTNNGPVITVYRDADGDGYGNASVTSYYCTVGGSMPAGYVANNTDCDDTTNTKWRYLSSYTDTDGDGYGTGTVQSICSGTWPPVGYSLCGPGTCMGRQSAITDCAPNDINNWDLVNLYRDADGDGYSLGTTTAVCMGGWYGVPAGYFETATSPVDCYDSNANAKPGQCTYYSVHRGDGSFDYDCKDQPECSSNCPTECGAYQSGDRDFEIPWMGGCWGQCTSACGCTVDWSCSTCPGGGQNYRMTYAGWRNASGQPANYPICGQNNTYCNLVNCASACNTSCSLQFTKCK